MTPVEKNVVDALATGVPRVKPAGQAAPPLICEQVTDVQIRPVLSTSLTVVLAASAGPRLLAVTVYTVDEPATKVPTPFVFEIVRFATILTFADAALDVACCPLE